LFDPHCVDTLKAIVLAGNQIWEQWLSCNPIN
jgi:hypothetical protein